MKILCLDCYDENINLTIRKRLFSYSSGQNTGSSDGNRRQNIVFPEDEV